MPDDPAREKPPADEPVEPAPKSPEEMMGALLKPAPTDNTPMPPEDYDSHLSADAAKRPARPEDMPIDDEKAATPGASDQSGGAPSEVARRFIEMQNQAATLADLLKKEEISFEDYQRLLYEGMVQDEQGVWWMIDAENEDWYRHDPERNQWEVDYPAALRESHSAPFNGDETLTEYDLPASMGAPAAGDPIYDERGVKIGTTRPRKMSCIPFPGRPRSRMRSLASNRRCRATRI